MYFIIYLYNNIGTGNGRYVVSISLVYDPVLYIN